MKKNLRVKIKAIMPAIFAFYIHAADGHINKKTRHDHMNNIVKGDVVKKYEYPFFAAFIATYNDKPGHIPGECGGTVVSDHFIITAAHCLVDYPTLAFDFFLEKYDESDKGVMLNPIDVVYYKNEEPVYGLFSHDIAMVRVKETIPKQFQNVTLWDGSSFPQEHGGLGIIPQSFNGVVIGNGETGEGLAKSLLEAKVYFYPATACQAKGYENLKFVPGKEICAGGMLEQKGAYHGDSGGPLFIKTGKNIILLGVVSRGPGMPSVPDDIKPGIYTSIAAYKPWIECIISKDDKTRCSDL